MTGSLSSLKQGLHPPAVRNRWQKGHADRAHLVRDKQVFFALKIIEHVGEGGTQVFNVFIIQAFS
jgi:hypothetical protein